MNSKQNNRFLFGNFLHKRKDHTFSRWIVFHFRTKLSFQMKCYKQILYELLRWFIVLEKNAKSANLSRNKKE